MMNVLATALRNTKTTLVLTVPGAGAETRIRAELGDPLVISHERYLYCNAGELLSALVITREGAHMEATPLFRALTEGGKVLITNIDRFASHQARLILCILRDRTVTTLDGGVEAVHPDTRIVVTCSDRDALMDLVELMGS